MNQGLVESSEGSELRTWRWGIGLALVAVLYVAAVVAFIIVY
jgi:ABC-type multidrug transport system permease subunit